MARFSGVGGNYGAAFSRASDSLGAAAGAAGGAGGFAGALSAAAPYLQVAQMVFQAVSAKRAETKAKRADNEATAVVLQDVQLSEVDENIDIGFGYRFGTQGHFAYAASSSNARLPSGFLGKLPADRDRVRSEFGRTVAWGKNNEYLLTQYVISVGKTGRLVSFKLDNRDPNKSMTEGGLRTPTGGMGIAWKSEYGVADEDVKVFAGGTLARPGGKAAWQMSGVDNRGDSAKYEGLSVVNFLQQLPENTTDTKYRVFTSIPKPFVESEGIELRRLTKAGSVVSLKEPAVDEILSAAVMWYLGNAECGPGLGVVNGVWSLSEFGKWVNVDALYEYQGACLYGLEDVSSYKDSGNEWRFSEDLTGEVDDTATHRRNNSGLLNASGVRGANRAPGLRAGAGSEANVKPKHVGAYSGKLSSGLRFVPALDRLFQCLPYTSRYFDGDGKLKVVAPNWWDSSAAQSVFTLTDAHLLEPVNEELPDVDSRYNMYSVVMNDENKEYHKTTYSWPDVGDANHVAYLAEDGGEDFRGEERVSGVSNPDIARSIARTRVLTSRRGVYTVMQAFTASRRLFEPGDVLTVDSVHSKVLGRRVMVLRAVTDFFGGYQRLVCLEHVHTDFRPDFVPLDDKVPSLSEQWNYSRGIGARVVVGGVPVDGFVLKAGTPVTLRATVDGYAGGGKFKWGSDGGVVFSSGESGADATSHSTVATVSASGGVTCVFTPSDVNFRVPAQQELSVGFDLVVGVETRVRAAVTAVGDGRVAVYMNGPGVLSGRWTTVGVSGVSNDAAVVANTPVSLSLESGKRVGSADVSVWTGADRAAAIVDEDEHDYDGVMVPFSLRTWSSGGSGRNVRSGEPCVFLQVTG